MRTHQIIFFQKTPSDSSLLPLLPLPLSLSSSCSPSPPTPPSSPPPSPSPPSPAPTSSSPSSTSAPPLRELNETKDFPIPFSSATHFNRLLLPPLLPPLRLPLLPLPPRYRFHLYTLQIQDAQATMLIYKKYQKGWEKSIERLDKLKQKIKKKHKKKSMEKAAAESDETVVLS